MMDDYVDKYVYEAAVDIKYIDPSILEKIVENTKNGNHFTYDNYDSMSSSSRNCCKHCKEQVMKRPTSKK